MITAHTGKIGGGKTYSVVVIIADYLMRGATVVTNCELNVKALREYVGKRRGVPLPESSIIRVDDPAEIMTMHRKCPKGSPSCKNLIVIDEAHCYFDARGWQSTEALGKEFLWFLTQSRKVDIDVIFITQALKNLDARIVRNCQQIYVYRDMRQLAVMGMRWPFSQILRVQLDYDQKTVIRRDLYSKSKEIFGLYDSFAIVRPFPLAPSTTGASDEEKKAAQALYAAQKRKKTIRAGVGIAALLAIVGFTYFQKSRPNVDNASTSAPAPALVESNAPVIADFVVTNDHFHSLEWSSGKVWTVWTRQSGAYRAGQTNGGTAVLALSPDYVVLSSTQRVTVLANSGRFVGDSRGWFPTSRLQVAQSLGMIEGGNGGRSSRPRGGSATVPVVDASSTVASVKGPFLGP